MKVKQKILTKYYVNITEIHKLLDISYAKAKQLFDLAYDQEKEEYQFRPHDFKVELKRVLKIARIDYNFLCKQIKNAQEFEAESAK